MQYRTPFLPPHPLAAACSALCTRRSFSLKRRWQPMGVGASSSSLASVPNAPSAPGSKPTSSLFSPRHVLPGLGDGGGRYSSRSASPSGLCRGKGARELLCVGCVSSSGHGRQDAPLCFLDSTLQMAGTMHRGLSFLTSAEARLSAVAVSTGEHCPAGKNAGDVLHRPQESPYLIQCFLKKHPASKWDRKLMQGERC